MTATDQSVFLKDLDARIRGQLSALSPAAPGSGSTTPPTPKPPTTPPPTPAPGAGGTVIAGGFTDRHDGDPAAWSLAFEENFPTLAAKGRFLQSYGKWGGYPSDFHTTDGQGHYDPSQVAVVVDEAANNIMVINCDPAGVNGSTPCAATMHPAISSDNDCRSSVGMRISYRTRIKLPASFNTDKGDYHKVPLLWPTSENWPHDAELDIEEEDFDSKTAGAFIHNMGASAGNDQEEFSTLVDLTQWHVFTAEWLAGKSLKLFIDGKQITPNGAADLKKNGYLAPDGMTLIKRVGSSTMRLELQHESVGKPTFHAESHFDWITIEFPK